MKGRPPMEEKSLRWLSSSCPVEVVRRLAELTAINDLRPELRPIVSVSVASTGATELDVRVEGLGDCTNCYLTDPLAIGTQLAIRIRAEVGSLVPLGTVRIGFL